MSNANTQLYDQTVQCDGLDGMLARLPPLQRRQLHSNNTTLDCVY
jgi:hypothetical protein